MDNKDNDLAKKLKLEGDAFFQKKEFYVAAVKYNASLCNAVMGSEEMAAAYAGRSKVYFELDFHEKAFSNGQKALEYPCSDALKTEILVRKEFSENCLRTMTKEDTEDLFKLSSNPNPKYPSFADCIELRSNEKYGRYLITNRDLNIGEIIAIDEFSFYSTNKGEESTGELINYQICSFCLKSNLLDLHPCPKCAFAMHCSEECYQDHLQRGHKYECGVMTELMKIPDKHLVFKSFFAALSICEFSMTKLIELIDEAESFKKQLTVFDFDFSKMTQQEKDKKFIQLMYLSHRKKYSKEAEKSFIKTIEEIFNSDVTTRDLLKDNKEFIIKFMTRIREVLSMNAFQIGLYTPRIGMSWCISGKCVCPGLTLFSHSCIPNVERIINGKYFAIVVTRKVKAGDQIFISYGPYYMDDTKRKRQDFLVRYGFICDCEACQKNYPLYEDSNDGPFPNEATLHYNDSRDFFSVQTRQSRAKSKLNEIVRILNCFPVSESFHQDYDLLTRGLTNCLAFIWYAREKFLKNKKNE